MYLLIVGLDNPVLFAISDLENLQRFVPLMQRHFNKMINAFTLISFLSLKVRNLLSIYIKESSSLKKY